MNWATISAVALRPARGNEVRGRQFVRDAGRRLDVHRVVVLEEHDANLRQPPPRQLNVLLRDVGSQGHLHGHEVDEQAVGAQLGTAELRVNQGGDSRAEERRVAQLERERVGTAVLHCYGVHGAPGPAPAGGRAA